MNYSCEVSGIGCERRGSRAAVGIETYVHVVF